MVRNDLDPIASAAADATRLQSAARDDRYRQFLEAAPDAVFLLGIEGAEQGRILDANNLAAAMHGYHSSADLIGLSIAELDVPEDAVEVPARMRQLVADGHIRFAVRHRRRDGSTFPVEVSARLAVVEGHRCAVTFNRDASENESSEQRLRDDGVRLRLAAQAADIGYWDWNLVDNSVFFSEQWKAQLGYAPHEIASHYGEWESRVHPDDLPASLAQIRAHLDGKTPHLVTEFRLRHRDGSYRWIYSRGQIVHDAAGAPQRMVGCHVDVTARKLAEMRFEQTTRRMRAIYAAEPECIKTVSVDGRLLDMNPAGLRMIEADSLEQARDQPVANWIHAQDRAAFVALHERVTRGESGTLEFRIVGLRGTQRCMETHAVPLRGPCGAVIEVLGVTRDITARREAEAARSDLARHLEQAQRLESLGTLSGGIAHDFNNILAAIGGNLELALQEPIDNPLLRECLEAIGKASGRARSLVRQILTFGRSQPADKQPVDLGAIVAEGARFMRATISTAIAIDVQVATGLPPVLADATQLHQVLINLCTNAAQAMADRPGTLAIRLSISTIADRPPAGVESLRPGDYICLCVQDQGGGMAEEVRKRAFEPFFTTKPLGQGTGLGLSVVHGIVHAHAGAIAIDSSQNQGTTVRVYLPTTKEHVVADTKAPPPTGGCGEHVLLIDDEKDILSVLEKGLRRSGYRVTASSKPAEALANFGRDIDVVVTDCEMPELPGPTVARAIAERRPEVPVILCSGHLRPEVAAEARAAGVKQVLLKPIGIAQLTKAVEQALARSRTPSGGVSGAGDARTDP